jgi:hypothetical protein
MGVLRPLLAVSLLLLAPVVGAQEYGKSLLDQGSFDKDLSGWQAGYGQPTWDGQ